MTPFSRLELSQASHLYHHSTRSLVPVAVARVGSAVVADYAAHFGDLASIDCLLEEGAVQQY